MEDKLKCNMLFQKHSLLIELHKRKLYQKEQRKTVIYRRNRKKPEGQSV